VKFLLSWFVCFTLTVPIGKNRNGNAWRSWADEVVAPGIGVPWKVFVVEHRGLVTVSYASPIGKVIL